MPIPNLTAKDCDDVINTELQLGGVFISGKVHNKITYHVKNTFFYVYEDNKCVYTTAFMKNALDFYNQMNKKVDL